MPLAADSGLSVPLAVASAMARHRQFDRSQALQAAIRLFWTKGYAGTSADDLVQAMGIARQSLYDTFGNKRSLYLEALGTYSSRNVAELIQVLRAERSPLAAMHKMLLAPVTLSSEERAMGCFGINAVCEFGVGDVEVSQVGAGSRLALSAALEALTVEAKAAGEIRADVDVSTAHHYLSCVLAGLKVACRGGASPDALKPVVELALQSLAPSPST